MMMLLLLPAFFAFYSGSGPNLVSICLTLCLYSARVCSNIVLAKKYQFYLRVVLDAAFIWTFTAVYATGNNWGQHVRTNMMLVC